MKDGQNRNRHEGRAAKSCDSRSRLHIELRVSQSWKRSREIALRRKRECCVASAVRVAVLAMLNCSDPGEGA